MGAVAVPERTAAQRSDALQKANDTRLFRARFKRRVAAGEVDVPSLLAGEFDPRLRSMKVDELLLAQRGWGGFKVNRLLRSCAVSPAKTLGGLTERQRLDLVRGLYGQPPARRFVR